MTHKIVVNEPLFARKLFSEVGAVSIVWLLLRLWLGWEWISAGWGKITGTGAHPWGPESLLGFWQRAVAIPQPPARPAIVYDWYRAFLELLINIKAESWMASLVAWGEFLVGIAIILGIFVGIAAMFGAFMNMNFMLAGSASTNPVLLLAAILLMLAWKTAGWWGLDRWLLPRLGTPWSKVQIGAVGSNTKPKSG
jgi:thiosulfate dehydrogenase [quinone] large subunit